MDWDDEYDLQTVGGGTAGPSFMDRVRNAAPDEDEDEDIIPGVLPVINETPLEQLIRHWTNERHAPDLLAAQEDLLANLLDHLRRQSETVQLLRGDASTSEEEHIRIMLAQVEIERVKFIVRSYVRTRLFKIEKYARYITTNAEIQTRMTAAERAHASRQANMIDRHLYSSVLQSLPPTQGHLDDVDPLSTSEEPKNIMITEPDRTRPVFAHALQNCPPVHLPDGESLKMAKGHISLVPFYVVEHLVARGEAELV
ncbi:hypothetical protein BDZ94DRAFT_1305272 [Collybia nuda]|uniref:DNA replication complex GINS protein SLD5 n=1 Tax=Collybia nuda TaxID=64659 RepID=A0A9P6CP52_9AGAR|nr:hypothetical protein BDZ94DRAFT_1305272 [Collybia nuda]